MIGLFYIQMDLLKFCIPGKITITIRKRKGYWKILPRVNFFICIGVLLFVELFQVK